MGCGDASAVDGVLVEVDSMGKGVGMEMGMRMWKKTKGVKHNPPFLVNY